MTHRFPRLQACPNTDAGSWGWDAPDQRDEVRERQQRRREAGARADLGEDGEGEEHHDQHPVPRGAPEALVPVPRLGKMGERCVSDCVEQCFDARKVHDTVVVSL